MPKLNKKTVADTFLNVCEKNYRFLSSIKRDARKIKLVLFYASRLGHGNTAVTKSFTLTSFPLPELRWVKTTALQEHEKVWSRNPHNPTSLYIQFGIYLTFPDSFTEVRQNFFPVQLS